MCSRDPQKVVIFNQFASDTIMNLITVAVISVAILIVYIFFIYILILWVDLIFNFDLFTQIVSYRFDNVCCCFGCLEISFITGFYLRFFMKQLINPLVTDPLYLVCMAKILI